MGKKNKKAGNNAKKANQQTKAEEIEVSRPTIPETHPQSSDSTVIDRGPTGEVKPELASVVDNGLEDGLGAKNAPTSNEKERLEEPMKRSGENVEEMVDIEDVVTPTTPPSHQVDIAIEQDTPSSTIPASAEEDVALAQSDAVPSGGEGLQDEVAQSALEGSMDLGGQGAEPNGSETGQQREQTPMPLDDQKESETPAGITLVGDSVINADEELVQATEGMDIQDIPLEAISLDDNQSAPSPTIHSSEGPDTNANVAQEGNRSGDAIRSPDVASPMHTQAGPATPEQLPLSPIRSPGFQDLLSSRSPSRSDPRSPSPRISRDGGEAGPSRRPSASSPHSSPGHMSPSRSGFVSPIKSPRPRPSSFLHKPNIPVSAPIVVTAAEGMEEVIDDSAPFESIPLQATPPPVLPATLPSSPNLHPGSPTSLKRNSWSGFGMGKAERPDGTEGLSGHIEPVDTHSRSSISTIPPPRPSSSQPTPEAGPSNETEKPRLHAPPAHPHPFPIPSPNSPRPSHEKRPSNSGPSVPPPGPSAALGVKGISTFEKVISHTRPSWLPPKDRVEDETHYHQWEEMMSQAREVEKEKRKAEEAKRIERDKRLAINTPKWEEMLDEKTFNADKIRKDPVLRGIWFEGAPTYLRGKAWSLAIGNPLALSKDLYKSCVVRSQKAISSGRFPAEILERIETDLDKTLVNLHLFQNGSPLRADLHELICAWVVYRSDTAQGYASYINLLAAMFLLSSPPASAFLSLVNLLSRPVLRAFYTETQDEIDAFYRVFENLQADMFPKIFANCKNLGLKVPESWFRSVLVEQVPFEAACRLWDQIVLDGDGYIFRSALAIFGFLEPRLYFPDRDEIESVLEGRNHATQAIVDRERERAKLRGETYLEELDGKLSVFGLNEQALFDWLAKDGWKEARFERLVTREMPD